MSMPRIGLRVVSTKDPWNTYTPDDAMRDRLETAIAAALSHLASRWVDRTITRIESPKQRKGTRHWVPEYDNDTRVGVKALDATKATDEEAAPDDAETATEPVISPAAIAAAAAMYVALSDGDQPDDSTLATIVAGAVRAVLALIANSAARQIRILGDLINSLDQSGADMRAIRESVLAHYPAMQEWARGLAVQAATATIEGAHDATADHLAAQANIDVLRRWRSRRDEKVRPTHVKADGQEQPLHTPFVVGSALLMFPGDPRAPLAETANCRCRLDWRSKRSGRFLPQPGGTKGLEAKAAMTHTGHVYVRVGGRTYYWKPEKHPRDRHGKFISTGGEVRTAVGDIAKVTDIVDANHVQVEHADGKTSVLNRHDVTVVKGADGGAPTSDVSKVATDVGPATTGGPGREIVQHRDGWTGAVTAPGRSQVTVERHDTGETHTVPVDHTHFVGIETPAPAGSTAADMTSAPAAEPVAKPGILGIQPPGARVTIQHEGHPDNGMTVMVQRALGQTGGVGGNAAVVAVRDDGTEVSLSRHTHVVPADEAPPAAPGADTGQPGTEGVTDGALRDAGGGLLADGSPGPVRGPDQQAEVLRGVGDGGPAPDRHGDGGGAAGAGGDVRPAVDPATAGAVDGGGDRGAGGAGAPGGGADAGAGGSGTGVGDSGLPGGQDGVARDDAGRAPTGVTEADQPEPNPDAMPTNLVGGRAFTPASMDDLAPAGKIAKLNANMAALRLLRQLQGENRPATPAEQTVLARWSGWGGLPDVFDPSKPRFDAERAELQTLMTPKDIHDAEKNTLNAHYTDAHVVENVWRAVGELGFDGGRVLEPGSGSGTFIGFAPDHAAMVGVELDSTTAAISQFLYPNATIRNESFADTHVPDGSFDATIGNVPFGRYPLTDRRHNPNGENIHNHFILKSLALTRPGGIVAVLTSRHTLDSQGDSARRAMAERADLIGAVRLPSGSHQRASETAVIEDILFFRVRQPGEEPQADQSWLTARKQEVDGWPIVVNDYWAEHPEKVLGEIHGVRGQFGGDMVVRGDRAMPDLSTVLDGLVADAHAQGLTATPAADEPLPDLIAPDTSRHEGHIRREADGTFTQAVGGASREIKVPAKQAPELERLIGLRDTVTALLSAEAASAEDTPQIAALRANLNQRYDDYVAKHGAINRYTTSKSGARIPPRQGGFGDDPKSAVVRALENFDAVTQTATKSDVFSRRTIAPREIRTTADNPQDALALSMEQYGKVNLSAIAAMLGTDEPTARESLGNLVFEQPPLTADEQALAEQAQTAERLGNLDAAAEVDLSTVGESVREAGVLEPAAEYRSGNVRRKLAAAKAAAQHDPRFQANVDALQEVVPTDLGPEEIDGRLGAAWIDAPTVEAFLRDILNDPRGNYVRVASSGGGIWTVEGPKWGTAATQEWGTDEKYAHEIAQALLEQRTITVSHTNEDGKRIPDLDATLAAQAKAEEMSERFAEWLWEDPDRSRRLQVAYNDQFNSLALRKYEATPGRVFQGMSSDWQEQMHDHVKASADRIVQEPTVLLAHVVGAGKTATMVTGTQELRRLGLARKPAIVIPNHMLEQFQREYLEIYPQAKILAAGKADLDGPKRREFVARAATGDWDAVIMTRGAFEAIPMSPEQVSAYIDREMATLRAQLEEALASARNDPAQKRTVKKMQTALVRAEEKLKKKLDKVKDVGVTFEQTGIDYLMVDEAHDYSNLRTLSNIQGAGAAGADMATDLHMKMEYLRANNTSGRVATFASGTPIRNTVTQAYVMQRFLRPDLLEEAGIHSFDQWAATFGEVVEETELKPEGGGFRQTSRFARYRNVPELLRMFHTFADVKMAEDLNLKTPDLVGGKAQIVAVPPTEAQVEYIRSLGDRADAVRARTVEPEVDNMLKISTDGRKAALSMRLVGGQHEAGKIEAAADRIAGIRDANKDRIYGDDERPGALQIVFLDMGTPKDTSKREASVDDSDERAGNWNAYDTLKAELVARGVPANEIRFIHEAKNDAQKAEMFAAARNGRISVLVGSSTKMGVGTNIQKRAIAMHHLDAPWRPADVEQRDGRIIRQKNMNAEVEIFRYVTERSFDAYMWQTLERKAKFINQVMRGSLDVREIEDVGDTALNFAEAKALATGNPDMLYKAKADTLLTKLERLERTHGRQQTNMRTEIARLTGAIPLWEADAAGYDAAIAKRVNTRGEAFTMTVNGERFNKRADAAEAMLTALQDILRRDYYQGPERPVGTIGGHDVVAQVGFDYGNSRVISLRFAGVPGDVMTLKIGQVAALGSGSVSRLENALEGFETRRDRLRDAVATGHDEIARMEARIGTTFPRAAELAAVRAKSKRLAEKMERDVRRAEGQDIPFDPTIDTDRYDDPLLRDPASVDVPPPDANVEPSADPPGPPTYAETTVTAPGFGERVGDVLARPEGPRALVGRRVTLYGAVSGDPYDATITAAHPVAPGSDEAYREQRDGVEPVLALSIDLGTDQFDDPRIGQRYVGPDDRVVFRDEAPDAATPTHPGAAPAPAPEPSREERVASMQADAIAAAGLDDRWTVTGNYFTAPLSTVRPGDTVRTQGDGTQASPVELPFSRSGVLPTYANVPRTVDRVEPDATDDGYVVHFTDGTSTGAEGGDATGVGYAPRTTVYAAPAQAVAAPTGPAEGDRVRLTGGPNEGMTGEVVTAHANAHADGPVMSRVQLDDGRMILAPPSMLTSADAPTPTPSAGVALTTEDHEGRVGDLGHITRVQRGTVPTSMLADLPGVAGEKPGEHANRQGARWQQFLDDVRTNGITDPVFITVDPGQGPKISEGNHRRDAAVELGLPDVPVLIRYFGHAEQGPGGALFAPDGETATPEPSAPAGDPFGAATSAVRSALPAGDQWRTALNDILKNARRHHEGGDPHEAINLLARARAAYDATPDAHPAVAAALDTLHTTLAEQAGAEPDPGEGVLRERDAALAGEVGALRSQMETADTMAERAAIGGRWDAPGGTADRLDALVERLYDTQAGRMDAATIERVRDEIDAEVQQFNPDALDTAAREKRREMAAADDQALRDWMDKVNLGKAEEADRALLLAEYARRGLDEHGFQRLREGDRTALAERLEAIATSNADQSLARSGDYAAIRDRLEALGVTISPAGPGAGQETLTFKRLPVLEVKSDVHVRIGGRTYLWKSEQHPRDRHGKFISAGGEVRTAAGDLAKVTGIVDANHVQVQHANGATETVNRHDVTVTKAHDGSAPTARVEHVATDVAPAAPKPTDRSLVQHNTGWTGTVVGGHGADAHVQRHDTGKTEVVRAADLHHLGFEASAPDPTGDVQTLDDYSLISGLNGAPTPDVQQKLDAELTARASKQAAALLERVKPTEAKVTPLLHGIADDLGMQMRGLGEVHDPSGKPDVDARLKTQESLTRKIKTKSLERNKPTEQSAAKIGDALRYTMTADTADYAAHTQAVFDRLKAEGYTVKEADNSWVEGNTYKGINSAIVAPDGTTFELQFHTPESFVLKDGDLHDHYETMRDPAKPYADRLAASRACVALSAKLPDPPGVETVGDLKRYGPPEEPKPPNAKKPKVLDVASTDFGMAHHPADASNPSVLVGKQWGGWDDLPTTDLNLSQTPLNATEEMLASSSINKVVKGGEELRSGYDPHILITADGRAIVIDGHHRVAMYGGLHRDTMPAKIYDERTMGPIGRLANVPPEVSDALAAIKINGRPDGEGTLEDPIAVGDDLDLAVKLLGEGKHIRLNQPEQVATLVGRLAAEATRLRDSGQDAPHFDLCHVSVPGTNLFCSESKGIDRNDMPQFSGQVVPGSPAAEIANDRGTADVSAAFRAELQRRGISVVARKMPASHLRATQRELNGAKIGSMMAAIESGDLPPGSIFVTREGYVIDGHHRWAANVAVDVRDNRLGDEEMPVEVVDLDVGAGIDFANEFTKRMGIKPKAATETGGAPAPAAPGAAPDAAPTPSSDAVVSAIATLGPDRVAALVGAGGVEGATPEQLRALVDEAAKTESKVIIDAHALSAALDSLRR